MLRHAELCPSSPNLTQEPVVFHVVTGTKKKLEKTPYSREWQIFRSLRGSWKSLACFSPALTCISSNMPLCMPNAIQPDPLDARKSLHLFTCGTDTASPPRPPQSRVLRSCSRHCVEKFIFLFTLWITLPEPAQPALRWPCCKLTLGH